MMKSKALRKWACAVIIMTAAVLAGFMLYAPSNRAARADTFPAGHEVVEKDMNGDGQEAVEIPYDGSFTGICGIQAYAGLSNPYWIMGYEVSEAERGKGSHPIGSNSGDGRSSLTATFKINSSVAADAYLYLWAESFADNSACKVTVTVNGTEIAADKNMHDYFRGENAQQAGMSAAWDSVYHAIPITLLAQSNTVVVSYGENYTAWLRSFAVSPTADRIIEVGAEEVNLMGKVSAQTGTLVAELGSIGMNSLDDGRRGNAGKTGTVTYKINAAAGDYTLDVSAMAGNPMFNRASFKLNGVPILNANGKAYVELNGNSDWSFKNTRYEITLIEGINTLEVGSVLTTVNPTDMSTEVAADENTISVCNWYINALKIQRKAEVSLLLNTDDVITSYNPLRPVSTDGLKVQLKTDDQMPVDLSDDQYTVKVYAADGVTEKADGDLVKVTYNENPTISASYSVSHSATEGLPFAGREISFDGTQSTGKQSYYLNAGLKSESAISETDGRLFWIVTSQKIEEGGYTFGSNGVGASENRQVTLTVRVNNTGEAGKYLFKSYVNANNYEQNRTFIKVNNNEAAAVNINGPKQSDLLLPFVYEVELQNGSNTIEIKMCEQYSAWFETFEIAPIEYADSNSFNVEDASRTGAGCFDTATGIFIGNANDRSLTYYVATQAAKYEFAFKTAAVSGKKLTVSIDGGAAEELTTADKGSVSLIKDMTAGNHTVTVSFIGVDGNIDFMGMERTLCKNVSAMRIDTSEMTLTVDNGYEPNLAKLKVFVTYEGESAETLITTGYTVDKGSFDSSAAGDYVFTVRIDADLSKTATFTVTVKQVKAVSALEVDASEMGTLSNGAMPDYSKLTVKIVYNDGSKITAMSSDYTIVAPEGFDSRVAGEYTFTVRYNANDAISATFKLNVGESAGGDESEKKGCGSSIGGFSAAASIAFGLIVIAGALALSMKKRRKE